MKLRVAAVAIVVVVVGVIAVVLVGGRSGDERAVTLREGLPDAGFPLRGDRAGDEELQAQAIASWRDSATRDGDAWEGEDEDVHVLWAGQLEGEAAVVATAGFEAALLTRRDREADSRDPYWEVSTSRVDRSSPGVVAFEGAVLTPEDAGATFSQSQQEGGGSPLLREDVDGLWTRPGSALPPGALVLEAGVPLSSSGSRSDPVAVFTGGVPAVRELSGDVAETLTDGLASRVGGPAQRLRAAALAGTAEDPQPVGFPRIEVVAEGTTDVGEVTIVATAARQRPVLSAGIGGEREAGEETPGVRLGDADVDATGRAAEGPAFGAAYVQRADEAFLLLAGDDLVRRAEIRAGANTIAVVRRTVTSTSGAPTLPVAAVRAPWLAIDDGLPRLRSDVTVSGESASGIAVVPDVAADVVTID